MWYAQLGVWTCGHRRTSYRGIDVGDVQPAFGGRVDLTTPELETIIHSAGIPSTDEITRAYVVDHTSGVL